MRTVLVLGALVVGAAACGGEEGGAEKPTTGTTTGRITVTEEVTKFVGRFMDARKQGLPADDFLSAKAAARYDRHATGLWLYDDSLPGGPGGEYRDFFADAERGESGTASVELRINVAWHGDAPADEIVEVLTIDVDATGSLVVINAERVDDRSDDGLPLAVAKTRERIYHAAVRHDYETLESLLDPTTFSYSFGEEGDPIGFWKEQEAGHLPIVGDILPATLHTRFGLNDGIYVWPSAAAKLASEWTDADVEAMRDAGYSKRDIRAFEEQVGGYAGWRVGVRADGTWLYFISGD